MEATLAIVFGAIIIEGLITYLRTFFIDGKIQWQMLLAIGLGAVVAIAYRIDLFALVGLESTIPLVGCILTGILISRGSNYIFDLFAQIAKSKPPGAA